MLFNESLTSQFTSLLFLALFLWLTLVTIWLFLTDRHYRKLTGKTGKTDLKKVLEKLLGQQAESQEYIKKVEEGLKDLEKEGLRHVQRVGVVRFNPFSDTGGDQSFAIALLDGKLNGVVLTSLHTREATRTYVKPIEKGKSAFELSKEEKQALEKAKK